MPDKLLSVVIPSRNDDYMGNANWRLETTVNYLAGELARLNRLKAVEILVVDWGSEVPLHQAIRLNTPALSITRFIMVPVNVHHQVRGDSDYPDSIALNAGIRRSRGKFLCQTGNDLLWPAHFLRPLFDLLEGRDSLPTPLHRTQMIFSRKHIPWEIVRQEPDLKTLDRFIRSYDAYLPFEPLNPFFLAPGGSVVMDRDIYLQCRGYDEKLIYWGGNDVNLTLRVKLKHYALDMGQIRGMHVYHLQHYSNHKERPLRRKKENPILFGPFAANDPNWGLGRHQLAEFPPLPAGSPDPCLPDLGSPSPKAYRHVHFRNIAGFAFRHSPLQGLHALVHFLRQHTRSRFCRTVLGMMKIPPGIKKPPLYARSITGPWQEYL